MAQIPRKYIDNYTKALNGLSADVQKRLSDALAMVDFAADVADVRNAVIDIMELHLGPYTDMAAVLAAEFYDGLRELEVGKPLGAYADSGRESVATEKAVRGIMQDVVDGKPDVAVGKLVGRADYEIKKSAGECMYRNGKRDPLKPRFARVPSGGETCRFCIMLASRGFVYHSAKRAGENGHYHANCDCRIVPGFDGETKVEGYDPDAYYDMWKHPEKYEAKGVLQERVVRFTPAKTLEEAQEYAQKFVQESGFSPTFKNAINYKGLSVDTANEINKALEEAFAIGDIPKLSGIKVISPTSAQGKKVFSGSDSVAAYNFAEKGIFLNKNLLKDQKSFANHVKEAQEAFEYVGANLARLNGKQREVAERYVKAGRSLVDGETISGAITHEVGHHVDWAVLSAKGNVVRERMPDYAGGISGYAGSSTREYLAESFVAYMRGEHGILDPEYIKVLEEKTGAKVVAKAGDVAISKKPHSSVTRYGEYRGLSYQDDNLGKHIGDGSDLDPLKMVMDDTSYSEDRARQALSDMHSWTGEGYTPIRRKEGEFAKTAERIEEFIEVSPKYQGEVWRGIGVERDTADDIVSKLISGEEIDQLGISSWSTDISWAQEFADMNLDRCEDGVKVIFHVEENQTGVSIKHIASSADNDEVIASESIRYVLSGNIEQKYDPYDGDYLYIPVKEVKHTNERGKEKKNS